VRKIIGLSVVDRDRLPSRCAGCLYWESTDALPFECGARCDDSRAAENVRVIAATARDLEREIQLGRFREDLFYRINVVPIKLPPLRERIEDIPALCAHFIDRLNRRWEKNIQGIEPEAMSMLVRHDWPGNVRELENAVERAVILSEKNVLSAAYFSLPPAVAGAGKVADLFEGLSLKKARKIVESELIRKALAASQGNRTRACGLLEISHPALLSKIKSYGIEA
jgi:two-component system response regulator AtoC